jgi:hypothetical protein
VTDSDGSCRRLTCGDARRRRIPGRGRWTPPGGPVDASTGFSDCFAWSKHGSSACWRWFAGAGDVGWCPRGCVVGCSSPARQARRKFGNDVVVDKRRYPPHRRRYHQYSSQPPILDWPGGSAAERALALCPPASGGQVKEARVRCSEYPVLTGLRPPRPAGGSVRGGGALQCDGAGGRVDRDRAGAA